MESYGGYILNGNGTHWRNHHLDMEFIDQKLRVTYLVI